MFREGTLKFKFSVYIIHEDFPLKLFLHEN